MIQVLSCIAFEHEPWILLLAAACCVLGSWVTVQLLGRAKATKGTHQAVWTAVTGIVAGTMIWTTHFVAMIGFDPGVESGHDVGLTAASLLVAMAGATLAVGLMTRKSGWYWPEIGGAALGLGIALMHYWGMAGYVVAAQIEWNQTLVISSVVFGIAFGVFAANQLMRGEGLGRMIRGAGLLTASICALHFIGMGAMTIMPDPSVAVPPSLMPDEVLVLAVVVMMAIILGVGASSYFLDTRSEAHAAELYREMVQSDQLTGLPNRAFLTAQIDRELGEISARNSRIAITVFNLDRFKDINEVHGYAMGNAVLKTVARRARAVLRDGEVLVRLGGDEFAALKHDAERDADVDEFVARVETALRKPVENGGFTFHLVASFGVVTFPDCTGSADELLTFADQAMFRAKRSVTSKVCHYDPAMDGSKRSERALVMDLHRVLERDELVLHYQPQINVATGRLVGFEALVRWNHPKRGMVPPGEFIPSAEETGLILPIGAWVLREACATAATWPGQLKISVNVAPAQFHIGNFAQLVAQTLADTGLAPERLELEITETGILDNTLGTMQVVHQLKALGVTIVMDDFGTGYSSLSTLQSFPFDKIKIDRSFVSSLTTSKQSAAIVMATMILANSLDIPALAEGVEDEETLDHLKARGCEEAQGYFISRPVPLHQAQAMIDADESQAGLEGRKVGRFTVLG